MVSFVLIPLCRFSSFCRQRSSPVVSVISRTFLYASIRKSVFKMPVPVECSIRIGSRSGSRSKSSSSSRSNYKSCSGYLSKLTNSFPLPPQQHCHSYVSELTERSGSSSIISRSGSTTEEGASNFEDKPSQRKLKTFMVVGLGNHGHQGTRHSVGMYAIDTLALNLGLTWENRKKEFGGFVSQTRLQQDEQEFELILFKPKALMNINGSSVSKTACSFSLNPSHIYLIHDELERVVGKYNIKEGGSSGGHNGVQSCMDCLKSKDMPRLRIGIGRPQTKAEVVSYVLSNFPEKDHEAINEAMNNGLKLLQEHIWKRVKDENDGS